MNVVVVRCSNAFKKKRDNFKPTLSDIYICDRPETIAVLAVVNRYLKKNLMARNGVSRPCRSGLGSSEISFFLM